MTKGRRKNEQGAIMVEAVIYFPIVICIVVFFALSYHNAYAGIFTDV